MILINRETKLWSYLAPEIQGLITDGELLLTFILDHKESTNITDFSFLVFPFAKAYEGFLKKLFLDTGMIQPDEYYSDDIRIGRILNPQFEAETGNIFATMRKHSKERQSLSEILWKVWKRGRNSVFHYFPHNFKRLDYEEAIDLVREFIRAMELAVDKVDVNEHKTKIISKEEVSPLNYAGQKD